MQGGKAGSKIFRGENEGKANYTALISESFVYNCSFKRLISSYSWAVNPCWSAHIRSPSFTAMKRKLGLYLWRRDFTFHTATELSFKSNQRLKGKALPSSPDELGIPSSLESPVLEELTHCSGEQQIPAAKTPEETTGSMENKNNNLSLDHSWVPMKHPVSYL